MSRTQQPKRRPGPAVERRQTRVPIEDVTVEVYTPQGDPAAPELCDIMNLSEGGMLFRCRHPYSDGEILRLTFMPPESPIIVRTDAKVVHGRESRPGRMVGVQFGNLGVSERMSILRCVRKLQDN